ILELHALTPGEPYYIAILLVGAYQEVMGSNHNLFGNPNEAHIYIDDDGYLIKKVIPGTNVGEAVERAHYDRGQLHEGFRRRIEQLVRRGELSEAQGMELVEYYESRINSYTYLVNGSTPSRRL